MKRVAALALGLAIALPACAQRGGGHASFSSHSAPAFHSAPVFRGSPSAAFRYNGGPRLQPSYRYPQRVVIPSARYPVSAPAARPAFYNRNHPVIVNRPRRFPRGVGIYSYPSSVIGYFPYTGFYDDGFFDPDYFDSDFAQPYAPQPPDNGYAGSPSEYAQPEYAQPEYPPYPQPQPDDTSAYPAPPPPPEYSPYPQPQPAPPASPEMQYVPGSADTVTLIFKDGRPPEQIQNYIATRKTLTVLNGNHHREIPIADLDVPATIKANRETGVGFQLPASATR